jgi:hypothetical protein
MPVRRPGSRPALLSESMTRAGRVFGVPSRPKHPAQPLAPDRDMGAPRAAAAQGGGTLAVSPRPAAIRETKRAPARVVKTPVRTLAFADSEPRLLRLRARVRCVAERCIAK